MYFCKWEMKTFSCWCALLERIQNSCFSTMYETRQPFIVLQNFSIEVLSCRWCHWEGLQLMWATGFLLPTLAPTSWNLWNPSLSPTRPVFDPQLRHRWISRLPLPAVFPLTSPTQTHSQTCRSEVNYYSIQKLSSAHSELLTATIFPLEPCSKLWTRSQNWFHFSVLACNMFLFQTKEHHWPDPLQVLPNI